MILGTVTHVSTREPIVALTFDDGPHPEFTPRLLDVLRRYGAHATFFVVGQSADKYPEILRRMSAEGHAIGNHSWDHPSFPAITAAQRRQQMHACESVISAYSQKLFRPPYGNQTLGVRFDAWRLGYEVIGWNVSAIDWTGDASDAIFGRMAAKLNPGSIILLHDALFTVEQEEYATRTPTIDAVKMLLERYRTSHRFVTVPELLQRGQRKTVWWHQPGDATYLQALKRSAA
jgi:peptidoglycan/xylan/chitin deacetylase (PgdA/CDA1 family)